LALICSDADFTDLREIVLPCGAQVQRGRKLDDLFRFLDRERVDVVIVDSTPPDDHRWKSVLNAIDCGGSGQPLIVASHFADEFLWAEVLNLGGFDVLSEPFDEEEVVRVFDGALRERLRRPAPRRPVADGLAVGRAQERGYQRLRRLRSRSKQGVS
jgi:DNA-binding NtrC family response regulator